MVASAAAMAILTGTQLATQGARNKKAYHYQSNLLNRQQAFAEKTMKNLHQWEMQDYLKAGLNPRLTATGNTSSVAGGTAPSVDVEKAPNLAQIASAAKDLELKQAQIDNVKADTETKEGNPQNWVGKIVNKIENGKATKWLKDKVKDIFNKREDNYFKLRAEENRYINNSPPSLTIDDLENLGYGHLGSSEELNQRQKRQLKKLEKKKRKYYKN